MNNNNESDINDDTLLDNLTLTTTTTTTTSTGNTTGDIGMDKPGGGGENSHQNKSGNLYNSFLLHGMPKKKSSGFAQFAEKMAKGGNDTELGLSPNTLKNLMNPFGIRRASRETTSLQQHQQVVQSNNNTSEKIEVQDQSDSKQFRGNQDQSESSEDISNRKNDELHEEQNDQVKDMVTIRKNPLYKAKSLSVLSERVAMPISSTSVSASNFLVLEDQQHTGTGSNNNMINEPMNLKKTFSTDSLTSNNNHQQQHQQQQHNINIQESRRNVQGNSRGTPVVAAVVSTHHHQNQQQQQVNPASAPFDNIIKRPYQSQNNSKVQTSTSTPLSEFRVPLPKGTPKPNKIQTKLKTAKTPSRSHQQTQNKPSSNSHHTLKLITEIIKEKEYLVLKVLGKGGSGEVLLVMDKETRELFALKKVNIVTLDQQSLKESINEVELLYQLRNTDFIIHIFSWELDEKSIKILMEYGQCDLSVMMKKEVMSIHMLKFYWERMLLIVEDIHSRKIVHADLKPANFVWVNGVLKLIDFGIASRLKNDNTSIAMASPKGTLNFAAPEILTPNVFGESKMSPKSDIWSLGCILFSLVFGKTPFQDITHNMAKISAICSASVNYPPLPTYLENSRVLEVLKLCFIHNPKQRPTANELLTHPFLTFNENTIKENHYNPPSAHYNSQFPHFLTTNQPPRIRNYNNMPPPQYHHPLNK